MKSSNELSEARRALLDTRDEISPLLAKLDFQSLAANNKGYLRYAIDPVRFFVDLEMARYIHTIEYIHNIFNKSTTILDVGFFIPIIPIALSKLGYQVTSIEKFSFYGNSLDPFIELVTKKYTVKVLDVDIMGTSPLQIKERYDIVLLLAILEHLNGTPRLLLEKVHSLMKDDGVLITEVPNAAELSNRINFLIKGLTPFPPIEDYYLSDYPFSGHNREYTIRELVYCLEQSHFLVKKIHAFDHSSYAHKSFLRLLIQWIEKIGPPEWRPVVWGLAIKRIYDRTT